MTGTRPIQPPAGDPEASACGSRREFLGTAVATVAMALTGCGKVSKEEFLQHNFRELSKDELKTIIARLEREYRRSTTRPSRWGTNRPCPA